MTKQRNEFRQTLIRFIDDAYQMENQIAQVLQRQIDLTGDHPEVQSRLTQHLAETELQRKRMQQRLEAYHTSPSRLKEAASAVMGNMVGLTGAMRPEMLSRNLRDDYVTEHMEISTYTLLIAAARAFGDDETVRMAEMSLKEEIAMAEWIFARLEVACYADLEKEGIRIADRFVKEAKAGPSLRVTFEPLKDVQDARAAQHRKT